MRGLGSIDSVSSVLEGLARRLGLESKLLESRLRRDWVSIVGEPIASNTWPDQIRYKNTLSPGPQQCLAAPAHIPQADTHSETQQCQPAGELITDIVLRVGEIPRTSDHLLLRHHDALRPSDVTLSE